MDVASGASTGVWEGGGSERWKYTLRKKVSLFLIPRRDVTNQNSPWLGTIRLFQTRESLVSDIPAGGGKLANLFFTVYSGGLHIEPAFCPDIRALCISFYICQDGGREGEASQELLPTSFHTTHTHSVIGKVPTVSEILRQELLRSTFISRCSSDPP